MICIVGNCAPSEPLDPLFAWLRPFEIVLVTGPQRSGTRICAKMIAHDTGHSYVDEAQIGVDSLYRLWTLLRDQRPVVVQCPALCRHVHVFSADDTAIVLMRRDVEDIIASQRRIGWHWEELELARYDRSAGVIAEVKYAFWDDYQRQRTRHAFEVAYHSLAQHPLWVTKDLRWDFEAAQTSP
jgi:hypothetical protein